MSVADHVKSVTKHLGRQADDLRRGDLAHLIKMAPVLTRAIDTLSRAPVQSGDEEHLLNLRQTAEHNTQLIAAALRGIKTARAVLEQASPASFTGYDALGRSSEIGATRPRVERRS